MSIFLAITVALILINVYMVARMYKAITYMNRNVSRLQFGGRRREVFFGRLGPTHPIHWKPWTLFSPLFTKDEEKFLFG